MSLRSEDEEYAARAGTTSVYGVGDHTTCLRERRVANLYDVQGWLGFGEQRTVDWESAGWLDDGHAVHAPVGSFAANAFGLHDTLGNVWEWREDLLTPYAVPARARDGLRSVERPARQRVLRGGCFRNAYNSVRCAGRENNARGVELAYLGVRPARALDPTRVR